VREPVGYDGLGFEAAMVIESFGTADDSACEVVHAFLENCARFFLGLVADRWAQAHFDEFES
jgi:hypothetical protein